jgi:hypothetical protein
VIVFVDKQILKSIFSELWRPTQNLELYAHRHRFPAFACPIVRVAAQTTKIF